MEERDKKQLRIAGKRADFMKSIVVFFIINAGFWGIWAITSHDNSSMWQMWPLWPTLGWIAGAVIQYFEIKTYAARVEELNTSA